MSPTWSLTVALIIIVGVAVAANRIMKRYIEGPDSKSSKPSKRDRFTDFKP